MTAGPTGRPTGRPHLLTDDVTKRIAELMAAGNYLTTAAAEAGIGRSTLMGWVARGRTERERLDALDPDRPDPDPDTAAREARYVDLVDRIDRSQATAEASAVTAWMGRIQRGDWRAAATFLARTRPDTWGPRTHLRVTDDESQARIDAAVDAVVQGIPGLADEGEPQDPDGDGTA